MLSIAYVARYLGGRIAPGSDMTGSSVGWFDLDEINDAGFNLFAPEQPGLFARAAAYADQCVVLSCALPHVGSGEC